MTCSRQQRMRPRNWWMQQLLRLRDWWMLQRKLRLIRPLEADKASLLYLTDGDEVVLHKRHMGMGGDGASVISEGNTGVGARYKENNPRVMMNHCACHKSSLSAADGAAGVPELAVFAK